MKFLFAALSAVALTAPAHAAIVNSMSFNSTTGIGGIAAWPSPYTVTSNAAPNNGSTAENNYSNSGAPYSLSQSFTATTSGKISSIEIAISGTAPVSFNTNLYSAGANDVTNIGSGSYTPGSGGYSSNLFSDTSVQTWSGYTLPGATAGVLKFSLSGADQVPVVAGQAYIFEIFSATNPTNMVWFRNAANGGDYPDGQAFRARSPINGNSLRDMTIAVNIVPEPASLALLAMGFAGTLLIRKK